MSWTPAQRLLAWHHTHCLSGVALDAWCPENGLFEHQPVTWRDAFCAIAAPETLDAKLALRELKTRLNGLQYELR